jgi:hypothetical protein
VIWLCSILTKTWSKYVVKPCSCLSERCWRVIFQQEKKNTTTTPLDYTYQTNVHTCMDLSIFFFHIPWEVEREDSNLRKVIRKGKKEKKQKKVEWLGKKFKFKFFKKFIFCLARLSSCHLVICLPFLAYLFLFRRSTFDFNSHCMEINPILVVFGYIILLFMY